MEQNEDQTVTTITIDDVEYELDSLSADAKLQLEAIQVVEQKVNEAKQQISILQTARNAYATALRDLLTKDAEE